MKNKTILTETLNYFTESNAKGVTPPINGEYFTLKRGYKMRPSTVRKLNEIKAAHNNVNIYMNSIVDDAINYYYNHFFSQDF